MVNSSCNTTSILHVLFAVDDEPGPLIVYGIEELLPSFRLRHAQYYVGIAVHTQDLYLSGNVQQGLELFDQELSNIDVAWWWAIRQSSTGQADKDIDVLLMDFANATNHIRMVTLRPAT